MVPLRSDCGEGKTATWNETRRRSHLVLTDVTQHAPARAARTEPRRLSHRRWETALFIVAVASVLLFFLASFALSLWHSASAAYESSLTPAYPVIAKRVVPGDTLWKYAARYGDPNSYILDRVETIARDNHLSSSVPLVPGQVLRIAVQNPVILAQIEHPRHPRLASLPH